MLTGCYRLALSGYLVEGGVAQPNRDSRSAINNHEVDENDTRLS